MASDCIFCRIAAGEVDALVVAEDDRTMAFLDSSPISEGHTLVIPKAHYKGIVDIPEEEAAGVMTMAKRLAMLYGSRLGIGEFNVMQSSGKAAGQTVFHFHMHIVPRRTDDGLSLWLHKNERLRTDIREVYRKIVG